MMIQKSCISWYGGKGANTQRKLLEKILEDINTNEKKIFVDVFGGSGIISINVRNKIIKYNDINRNLYNFFKVIQDDVKGPIFKNKIEKSLYSEEEYKKYSEEVRNKEIGSEDIPDVESAIKFYIALMQSVARIGIFKKSGFKQSKSTIRRGMSQVVSAWKSNIDEELDKVIDKFRSIEVYNDDFRKCIKRFDSSDTIFYLDPPYIKSTRKSKEVYGNELTDDDHKELVEILLKIKGQAILSGYDNEIYKKLEENGWEKIKFTINSIQSGNQREENIWSNLRKV